MKHEERKNSTLKPAPSGPAAKIGTEGARSGGRPLGPNQYTGGAAKSLAGKTGASDNFTLNAQSLRGLHGAQITQRSGETGVAAEHAAALILTESALATTGGTDATTVRFEPYAFFQQTGRWLVATHKDQAAEHRAFEQARAIDPVAAHCALRMGLAQLAGSEAAAAGYDSALSMWQAMQGNPAAQIDGLFSVIAANSDLRGALAAENWREVAVMRAGSGYAALGYDDALAANATTYRKVSASEVHGGDDDDGKPKKRVGKPSK